MGLGAELNADEAIAHGAALLSVARLDPAALGHGDRGRLLLPVRPNAWLRRIERRWSLSKVAGLLVPSRAARELRLLLRLFSLSPLLSVVVSLR